MQAGADAGLARRATQTSRRNYLGRFGPCYPRYFDPKTGLACPVEVADKRLANGDVPDPNALNRLISKLQGVLASSTHLRR